jgi:hypothetical protein
MSVTYNIKIVTEGLVAYWDAANPRSYPGTGNKWYDLSGNGNTMNLSGTLPVVNGAMTFNGIDQIAECNAPNFETGTSTIICASRYAPGSVITGRVVNARNNNWLLGHHGNHVKKYYAEGWIRSIAEGPDSNWRIYAGTSDVTGDLYGFYINGENITDYINPNAGSAGPNGIFVGSQGRSPGEWSQCECGFIMAYNRVLTSEEIKQNFKVLRNRYGL